MRLTHTAAGPAASRQRRSRSSSPQRGKPRSLTLGYFTLPKTLSDAKLLLFFSVFIFACLFLSIYIPALLRLNNLFVILSTHHVFHVTISSKNTRVIYFNVRNACLGWPSVHCSALLCGFCSPFIFH